MIASCVSGVHTATQGSGSLARTVPLANAVRNRAGMLSRFFASNECSKWPRNAKRHDQGVQTGVAEWEEPRHSGRLLLPPYPTIPHSSVRWRRRASRPCPVFGSAERVLRGRTQWGELPPEAPIWGQRARMGASLHADRPFGGFLAVRARGV